jgi:16S rRNA (cytosine1402-N4)-methyltransferase
MSIVHIPVMPKEILEQFSLSDGDVVIDATLDGGGHAQLFCERVGDSGVVIGIEQDPGMVRFITERAHTEDGVWKRLVITEGNFKDIGSLWKSTGAQSPRAILFDLGISRWHYKESNKGFSFLEPSEPLVMTMSSDRPSVASILNGFPEAEIADILWRYGELRNSRSIAKDIVAYRAAKKFITVEDLLKAIGAVSRGNRHTHQATRVFQALRIAANDELHVLETGLREAWDILAVGGHIAVLTYHSLEDRIVKNLFKEFAVFPGSVLTKKVIKPQYEEIRNNPSARSAKLRIIQK